MRDFLSNNTFSLVHLVILGCVHYLVVEVDKFATFSIYLFLCDIRFIHFYLLILLNTWLIAYPFNVVVDQFVLEA